MTPGLWLWIGRVTREVVVINIVGFQVARVTNKITVFLKIRSVKMRSGYECLGHIAKKGGGQNHRHDLNKYVNNVCS